VPGPGKDSVAKDRSYAEAAAAEREAEAKARENEWDGVTVARGVKLTYGYL